jgi:hypothetical protein
MKIVDTVLTEEKISEILETGVCCSAEIVVGEAVSCILKMVEHMPDSQMMQHFISKLGPEHTKDVHDFIISFVTSEISTLVETFKNREFDKVEA